MNKLINESKKFFGMILVSTVVTAGISWLQLGCFGAIILLLLPWALFSGLLIEGESSKRDHIGVVASLMIILCYSAILGAWGWLSIAVAVVLCFFKSVPEQTLFAGWIVSCEIGSILCEKYLLGLEYQQDNLLHDIAIAILAIYTLAFMIKRAVF